jgi:hypothetical protein
VQAVSPGTDMSHMTPLARHPNDLEHHTTPKDFCIFDICFLFVVQVYSTRKLSSILCHALP